MQHRYENRNNMSMKPEHQGKRVIGNFTAKLVLHKKHFLLFLITTALFFLLQNSEIFQRL